MVSFDVAVAVVVNAPVGSSAVEATPDLVVADNVADDGGIVAIGIDDEACVPADVSDFIVVVVFVHGDDKGIVTSIFSSNQDFKISVASSVDT